MMLHDVKGLPGLSLAEDLQPIVEEVRALRLRGRTVTRGAAARFAAMPEPMPFDVELIERTSADGVTEYLVTMEGGRVQMGNGVFVDVEGVDAEDEFVIVPAAGAQLVLEVTLSDANAATATLRVETPAKLITCKPTRADEEG